MQDVNWTEWMKPKSDWEKEPMQDVNWTEWMKPKPEWMKPKSDWEKGLEAIDKSVADVIRDSRKREIAFIKATHAMLSMIAFLKILANLAFLSVACLIIWGTYSLFTNSTPGWTPIYLAGVVLFVAIPLACIPVILTYWVTIPKLPKN